MQIVKVVIPPATEKRPEQRFGFVHFEAQDGADSAVTKAEGGDKPVLDENTLEVMTQSHHLALLQSEFWDDIISHLGSM